MRMRAHVNGLLPLITSTVIEYPNGEEVTESLVYERLERHCTTCLRLDHDIHDCLEEKAKKRLLRASQEADRSKQASQTSVREGREAREQSPRDNTIYHFSASNRAEYRERRSHYDQELQGRRQYKLQPKTWKEKEEYRRASQARERSRYPEERYNARMSTSVLQKRQASSQSRSYYRAVVRNPGADIDNGLSSVRSQSRNFEKGIPLPEPVPSLPTEALQQARKEVHDAMLQCTRVADPSEMEAREERMRLAEDLGEMEETTTNMVQAAMHLSAEKHGRIQITDTPERIPAVQRLSVPESHECIPTSARLGPCPLVQEPVQRTIPPNGDIVNAERLPASLRLDYPPETVLPPTTTGSTVKRKPG